MNERLFRAGNALKRATGNPEWRYRVVVAGLTLAGFLLRVYRLGEQSFWIDEATTVTLAKAIRLHGAPLLSNGRCVWDSPVFHYLLAPWIGVFGDVHWDGRFLPVLFGTLSIPVFAAWNRRLSGSGSQALFAASLLAVSGYEIAWSRQARFYTMLQFLLLAGSWFLLVAFHERKRSALAGWALCSALAVITHRGGFLLPLWVLWGGLLATPELARSGRARPALLKAAGWGMPLLAVAVIFLTPIGREALAAACSRSGQNYAAPYAAFLWEDLRGMLAAAGLGLLAGLVRRPRETLFVAVPAALYLVVLSFQTELFAFRYLLPIFPVFLGLAAFGFEGVIAGANRLFRRRHMSLALWTVAVASALFLVPWNHRILPVEIYTLGRTAPQPDWKEAYRIIREREVRLAARGEAHHPLVVVSALPTLDDLYLDDLPLKKMYLPVTHSGLPEDRQWASPYSQAEPINSLSELEQVDGYLILDEFGMNMLLNREMQDYLARRKPNAIVANDAHVFIWVLQGPGRGAHQ